VIGASILAALGIALGFVLLIVPGLILLTLWCLLVPVIVLEGAPAMQASAAAEIWCAATA
jgi:hypothetical protein